MSHIDRKLDHMTHLLQQVVQLQETQPLKIAHREDTTTQASASSDRNIEI